MYLHKANIIKPIVNPNLNTTSQKILAFITQHLELKEFPPNN
jgi:hypothetical protein